MANRNWLSGGKIFSMHKDPVIVTADATIGASGAVTSFVGATVASFVQTGTGAYTITLQPNTGFPGLYFAHGSMRSPSSGLSGISTVEIQYNPNATVNANAAVLSFTTLNASGAAANPVSGSSINMFMFFSNSSVPSQATSAE